MEIIQILLFFIVAEIGHFGLKLHKVVVFFSFIVKFYTLIAMIGFIGVVYIDNSLTTE